jgi:hypothetical protein
MHPDAVNSLITSFLQLPTTHHSPQPTSQYIVKDNENLRRKLSVSQGSSMEHAQSLSEAKNLYHALVADIANRLTSYIDDPTSSNSDYIRILGSKCVGDLDSGGAEQKSALVAQFVDTLVAEVCISLAFHSLLNCFSFASHLLFCLPLY